MLHLIERMITWRLVIVAAPYTFLNSVLFFVSIQQTTQSYKQYARRILMSCNGRSFESVGMRPRWFIVFIPSLTRPKMVCLPKPHRCHTIQTIQPRSRSQCDKELTSICIGTRICLHSHQFIIQTMAKIPAPVNRNVRVISSSKG